MADWRDRPRYEGGRNLAGRQRARAYARRDLVPPSKNQEFQEGTTAYSDKARYNGTNRVKDGLLCEWWFDEGSGNTIIDRTPLTRESPLQWIENAGAGLLGEWSQDSSQNDRYYLNLSDGGAARNSGGIEFIAGPIQANEVTLETWFKPSNQNGLSTSGPGRIATISPLNTTYTDQCVMLGHGTWTGNSSHNARSYSARVKLYDMVHTLWSADDVADDTKLVHLVVTAKYNTQLGRAEARFYVDGTLVDSKDIYDADPLMFSEWDGDSRIAVGAERDGEKKAKGGYYLTSVYRRALTAAEVSKNFEEGVSPQSGGYKKGTRATLGDAETSLKAGEADKFEVSLSGGTHLGKLTVTLTASSDNAGFTLGNEFTLTPTSVDFAKGSVNQSVSLSCALDTSADHTVHVSIASISNNGGITAVVSPSNDANDSFDTLITSKAQKPELKFSFNSNPQLIPTQDGSLVDGFIVSKTRDYDEEISFTLTGEATPANVADYYFWSGAAPGVFSAPFQPNPGVNCGTNNQIHDSLYGNVTLSAYGGSNNITVDGTVIENAIITGTVNVKAANVTIRNCKISDGYYCINNSHSGFTTTGLLVEDCELYNADSTTLNMRSGTARRCWFHDSAKDLVKRQGNDTLVESCYFEKMGTNVGGIGHCDADQATGGYNHISRWNFYNVPSNVNQPPGTTHHAAIIWQTEFAWLERCVVDSNWFNGGAWAMNFNCKAPHPSANYTGAAQINDLYIINNLFYGDYDEYAQSTGLDSFELGTFNINLSNSLPGSTYEYFGYNNRLMDGTTAYQKNKGPYSSSPYLIDNVSVAPTIPFYDSPVGNKVDLSTGITLRIGGDELSKSVIIYSEATNSQGLFVDGDSVNGFLLSGDVRSGDAAGETLQVCSTLSTLTIEFEDAGLGRTGLGFGSSRPTKTGGRQRLATRGTYDDGDTEQLIEQVNGDSFIYQEPVIMSDEEYLNRIELPPTGGETSATTGPRISVTDHPHKDICWFVDPGQSNAANKIEVPQGGLIVSGYHFTEVRVKTSNPLKFIDCQFSGQTDCHNGVVQQYTVWDNNQGGGTINKKVDFEYCDFQGGGSITLMMNFRMLHKCRFDNVISDYIRFRDGNYRITNCWFGSYMKAPDSALNGYNGHYNENQGINPHADPMQNFLTENDIIHVADCTFNLRPANWSDGTTNPDHERGAYPDKIMQYGGTTANPNPPIGEMRFTNCILNGGGNYLIAASGPNKAEPATFSFKDCKFGTSCRSGFFGTVDDQHTLVDLGGNVWLETGTPGIRLPQEALDAGTTTSLGRNNLPISYVIRGLDNVNFSSDGMNEGGRTSWGQRGIGWG